MRRKTIFTLKWLCTYRQVRLICARQVKLIFEMGNTNGSIHATPPVSGLTLEASAMPEQPQNLHMGVAGSSNDITTMMDRDTCASAYYVLLEECLGENDRNWSKCQKEVKLLKMCTEALKNKE